MSEGYPQGPTPERVEPQVEAPPRIDDEKVTIAWLMHHVSVPTWFGLLGLVLTTLVFGATVGQTTFVQEVMGRETQGDAQETFQTFPPDKIRAQVDQLVEGHNESVQQLYRSIASEEELAGAASIVYERNQHIEAAERLRETVEAENSALKARITELRALSCGSVKSDPATM